METIANELSGCAIGAVILYSVLWFLFTPYNSLDD